jgi:hypothetical protein
MRSPFGCAGVADFAGLCQNLPREVLYLLWNQRWDGDLGSGGETHGGSTPPFRTKYLQGFAFSAINLCAQICAHLP